MTINLTAYAIEILRAGLEAVPAGQSEAGRGLGLRPMAIFGLIVLPQAFANVYPALIGQITITMLESAVVSQIAVVDLTHVADFIQSRNFRSFETYLVITLVYLVLAVADAARAWRWRATAVHGAAAMTDFTLWDIARNLLLAARWTILLSAIAFAGGAVFGLLLLLMRIGKRQMAAGPLRRSMPSCSRARRC